MVLVADEEVAHHERLEAKTREVAPHLIFELRRRSPTACHHTASSPRRIWSLSKMASTTPKVASRRRRPHCGAPPHRRSGPSRRANALDRRVGGPCRRGPARYGGCTSRDSPVGAPSNRPGHVVDEATNAGAHHVGAGRDDDPGAGSKRHRRSRRGALERRAGEVETRHDARRFVRVSVSSRAATNARQTGSPSGSGRGRRRTARRSPTFQRSSGSAVRPRPKERRARAWSARSATRRPAASEASRTTVFPPPLVPPPRATRSSRQQALVRRAPGVLRRARVTDS